MKRGSVIILERVFLFVTARSLTLTLSPEGERGQPLDRCLKSGSRRAEGCLGFAKMGFSPSM